MIFKKQFRINVLTEQVESLQNELYYIKKEVSAWKKAAEASKADLNIWREKYELSQLSPEIKADIEAAFKRGASFARTALVNNIRLWIDNAANVDIEEKK